MSYSPKLLIRRLLTFLPPIGTDKRARHSPSLRRRLALRHSCDAHLSGVILPKPSTGLGLGPKVAPDRGEHFQRNVGAPIFATWFRRLVEAAAQLANWRDGRTASDNTCNRPTRDGRNGHGGMEEETILCLAQGGGRGLMRTMFAYRALIKNSRAPGRPGLRTCHATLPASLQSREKAGDRAVVLTTSTRPS